MVAKIYLQVPYNEKNIAKSLGAKWDPNIKKWFYRGSVKDFIHFRKWILSPQISEIVIAHKCIYIIEGKRRCYYCGRETTIIGIGLGAYSELIDEGDWCEINEPEEDDDDNITLSWFYDEEDIPPLLRRYLKNKYNVKMKYSKTTKSVEFANSCEYCDALQGNFYIFDEDSSLSTSVFEQELVDRMKKLKIYRIHIDEALLLNVSVKPFFHDWAYKQYANFQDLIISPTGKFYTPYAEMYELKRYN